MFDASVYPLIVAQKSVDAGFTLTREEALFLQTCHEIELRCNKDTEYDLLILSSLVRKLILDGTPLYVLANRRPRLKIAFPFNSTPLSNEGNGNVFRGFGQSGSIGLIGRFLKTECILLKGQTFTVHEVIDAAAHKHGGVHFSVELTDKERLLTEWRFEDVGIKLQGGGAANPMLALGQQIAYALLSAFQPLIETLRPPLKRSLWSKFVSLLFMKNTK